MGDKLKGNTICLLSICFTLKNYNFPLCRTERSIRGGSELRVYGGGLLMKLGKGGGEFRSLVKTRLGVLLVVYLNTSSVSGYQLQKAEHLMEC